MVTGFWPLARTAAGAGAWELWRIWWFGIRGILRVGLGRRHPLDMAGRPVPERRGLTTMSAIDLEEVAYKTIRGLRVRPKVVSFH